MIDSIISAIVGLVGGGAGSMLIFYPQMKKTKVIENEAKQSEEWLKLYKEERDQRDEDRKEWEEKRVWLESQIKELHSQINTLHGDNLAMAKQMTELEVELTRLRLLKCEVVNCLHRKPPTGY